MTEHGNNGDRKIMTVDELMGLLEQYPSFAEVRVACQPMHPFDYAIKGTVSNKDLLARIGGTLPSEKDMVVWLVEGELIGTLTDEVWREEFRRRNR